RSRAVPRRAWPAPVRPLQRVVTSRTPGAEGVVRQPGGLVLDARRSEAFVQNPAIAIVRAQELRPDLVAVRAIDVPGWERIVVVLHVHLMGEGDLAEIGDAVRPLGRIAVLGEHAEQDAGED